MSSVLHSDVLRSGIIGLPVLESSFSYFINWRPLNQLDSQSSKQDSCLLGSSSQSSCVFSPLLDRYLATLSQFGTAEEHRAICPTTHQASGDPYSMTIYLCRKKTRCVLRFKCAEEHPTFQRCWCACAFWISGTA